VEIKAEIQPSKLRRCNGWDYRQPCIYQITIVLANRKSQLLGRLVVGEAAAPEGKSSRSVLEAAASSYTSLSPAGEAVKAEFFKIGEHHPEIKPLEIMVMPDHCHFIIRVMRPMAKPLGNAIGGFKAGSSKAAIGKPGLWADGFQDTILYHEGQLAAMFTYLRDNPRRLAVKRLMPELFRVRRGLKLPLQVGSNHELPLVAQNKNPELPLVAQNNNPELPLVAESNLKLPLVAQNKNKSAFLSCSEPKAEAFGFFTAIGNHFLLRAPSILQVQVSRRDFAYRRVAKPGGGVKIERDDAGCPLAAAATPAFIEKRDELMAAAEHGAVLISPCISDGEREIARLAFSKGLKVVTLSNKGFSPLYKPGGKLFDMTANGNLLMLAPINWPYCPGEKKMTRIDACILNRIAQWLAGSGAAKIDYKGMKPNDIDRLARSAIYRHQLATSAAIAPAARTTKTRLI